MLSNGARNLIDAKFIEEISKSNNLVDVLLRELVQVRSGQLLSSTQARKPSFNKEIVTIDGHEIAKNPFFATHNAADQGLQNLLFNVDSPKLGSRAKKVEFRNYGKVRTPIESDFYPQDIEDNISVSQSRASGSLNLKDKLQPILKQPKSLSDQVSLKRKISQLSESYADDFEEISESLMMQDADLSNYGTKKHSRKKSLDGKDLVINLSN